MNKEVYYMRDALFTNGTMSVPDAIALVLEQAGITTVFGMPGGRTGAIFKALNLHEATIRTVLVRHESLASVMAEVAGRLEGRPGVVLGQGAFLLANAALGALEAHLGSSPMLLMADLTDGSPFSHHAPYQAGTGDYGAWDARRAFEGFTKRVFVAYEGVQAVQATQLALKHAIMGEPGPVALLFHSAALTSNIGPDSRPALYGTLSYLASPPLPADLGMVYEAAGALVEAERPVIVAGNGVRVAQAYEELEALAELMMIPVATTAGGKGVFREDHPLAVGTIGNFGLDAAHCIVGEADVILAVGTKLSPTDTANENLALINPTRQIIIQVDVEPLNTAWTFPVDYSLIGDAATVIGQLTAAVQEIGVNLGDGTQRVADAHNKYGSFESAESFSDECPILPQRIVRELQREMPEDAIVACDAGENRIFMSHHFKTRVAGGFLQPASIGGMGYAIPAAMSAKLVFPERTCVAVCGDGGFAISMNGILTAIEEDIPITVLVFNNSALGWVLHGQDQRPVASQFGDFNYADIAQSMGCDSFRVERPEELGVALRRAMAANRPAVVDVVTSLKESFAKVSTRLLG